MSNNVPVFMCISLFLFLVVVVTTSLVNESWEKYLISQHHAEWRIDAKTGEASFELLVLDANETEE